MRAFGVIALCMVLGFGCKSKDKTPEAEIAPTLQTARIDTGDIAKIINATGTVRPDITVQVGSEVSGRLLTVDVDYNATVKQGDVLAVIDPDNFKNRVEQNRAQVESRRADIKINEASLKRAEVNAEQARRSLVRRQQLFSENAISKAQLEETEKAMSLADADIELAKARLEGSHSALEQAESALRTAQVDLSRTKILSPIDGVVIERLVDPGQTVAASFSSPELFKIAGDLSDIRVDAAIVEGDVAGLDAGDSASFTVDAYPAMNFRGEVEQLRLKSESQSNIVTYTAVVKADNQEHLLMPGMTTDLQITTNVKKDVLRLPAAAERFRPTPSQIEQWQSDTTDDEGGDADPRARERLNTIGLSAAKTDAIMNKMNAQTADLRKDIKDPDKSWDRISNIKKLQVQTNAVIRSELTSQQYQDYRRAVQEESQLRFAQIWLKDGDKMRPVTAGLGLSDGSYVEVVSGLKDNDEVIIGIEASAKPSKGAPGKRAR